MITTTPTLAFINLCKDKTSGERLGMDVDHEDLQFVQPLTSAWLLYIGSHSEGSSNWQEENAVTALIFYNAATKLHP